MRNRAAIALVVCGWLMLFWISLSHPDMGNGRLLIEFWPRYAAAAALCIAGFALTLVRR